MHEPGHWGTPTKNRNLFYLPGCLGILRKVVARDGHC